MIEKQRKIEDILNGYNWQKKHYFQLSNDNISELVGELAGRYSGMPKFLYRGAMKLDKKLDSLFIDKLRLSKRSSQYTFDYPYEEVVLAIIFALNKVKRKIITLSDTTNGSIIKVNIPINYLYIFIGIDDGILNFEIINKGDSTLIMVKSEIIGVFLLKTDYGRGKRNSDAIVDIALRYLKSERDKIRY